MKTRVHKRAWLFVAALTALAVAGEVTDTSPLMLGGREAHAIIGRPLTPMSYAGVARRTTRRAAYAGAAYGYGGYGYGYRGYYGGGYVAPTTVVTTLPGGCVSASPGLYTCGGAQYAPAFNGPTVVYRPVP